MAVANRRNSSVNVHQFDDGLSINVKCPFHAVLFREYVMITVNDELRWQLSDLFIMIKTSMNVGIST